MTFMQTKRFNMFKTDEMSQQLQSAEKLVKKNQEQRAEKQAKMTSLYQTLNDKNFSIEDSDKFSLDFENASLSNVKDAEDALNNNMVRLITSLDSTTSQLGSSFSTMRELTGKEKFVSFFSKSKAAEMRSGRIAQASIEQNLQDLISQSNSITSLLQAQLGDLENEHGIGSKNLSDTLDLRKTATADLASVRSQLEGLSPQIEELMLAKSNEEDATRRTEIESELNTLVQQENSLKDAEAVELNKSMTLERYIELNKSNVDSLNNQITAQKVMIQKLKTDTAQREVLYQSLEVSLKTAEQQETAHAINKIGTETDKVVQKMHAQIGASASNALSDMMEEHKGNMQDAQEVLRKKAEADEIFLRRFGNVAQEHDAANYNQ